MLSVAEGHGIVWCSRLREAAPQAVWEESEVQQANPENLTVPHLFHISSHLSASLTTNWTSDCNWLHSERWGIAVFSCSLKYPQLSQSAKTDNFSVLHCLCIALHYLNIVMVNRYKSYDKTDIIKTISCIILSLSEWNVIFFFSFSFFFFFK